MHPPERGFIRAQTVKQHDFGEDAELIPVATLCRQILGCKKEAVTIAHWRGGRINGGTLQCRLVHGVWCTTDAAFRQFIEATNIKRL